MAGDGAAVPRLMTPDEVCERLQISRRHLYRLVERRAIPHIRLGRRLRFVSADVCGWLDGKRVPACGNARVGRRLAERRVRVAQPTRTSGAGRPRLVEDAALFGAPER